VAADFSHITDQIDKESAKNLMMRATEYYEGSGEDEAKFIPSDFYFNAFIGQMCLVTNDEVISPTQSARVWALTDSFLDENPKYRTSAVTPWMNTWYETLMRLGAV